MIIMMVLVGFAFGAQPLIGYCIGANNKKRLKEVLRFDALVIISFACVMNLWRKNPHACVWDESHISLDKYLEK